MEPNRKNHQHITISCKKKFTNYKRRKMFSSTLDQHQLIRMHPHPYLVNYNLKGNHLLPWRHQPSLAPLFQPILYIFCNFGTSNLSWTSGSYTKFWLQYTSLYQFKSSYKYFIHASSNWKYTSHKHAFSKDNALSTFAPLQIS